MYLSRGPLTTIAHDIPSFREDNEFLHLNKMSDIQMNRDKRQLNINIFIFYCIFFIIKQNLSKV